jgi:hypothetical protein
LTSSFDLHADATRTSATKRRANATKKRS